jgi:hypothetical protein
MTTATTDPVAVEPAAVDRGGFWMTPRSRGVLTGVGLVLLGAWGAVIPFVGPYFDYAYTPNTTWTWTAARGFLQVLPGAVTFVAGLMLIFTRNRGVGFLASWMAIAAGAWFVLGPLLSVTWRANYLGAPVGSARDASMEQLGMFFGLGAMIMLLGGLALGRFSMRGVRDGDVVAAAPAAATAYEQRTTYPSEVATARQAVPVQQTAPMQPTTAAAPTTTEPAATAQQPVAQEPVAQEPVAQEPVAQEPVAQEPVAQDRTVDAGSGPRHGFQHRRRSVFHRADQ